MPPPQRHDEFWEAIQREKPNSPELVDQIRAYINQGHITAQSVSRMDQFMAELRKKVEYYARLHLSQEALAGLDIQVAADHYAKTLVLELKSEIEAGPTFSVGAIVRWNNNIYKILNGPRGQHFEIRQWEIYLNSWVKEDELELCPSTCVVPPPPPKIDPTLPELY